jgi:hypothetical protein
MIFGAWAALLVGQRSIKDILPPRALPQRQTSSNAPIPIFEMRSSHKTFPLQVNRTLDSTRPLFANLCWWIGFSENTGPVEDSPWRARTDAKRFAENASLLEAKPQSLR